MATKKDALIGRGVIAPIYEGEAIMESRLAAPGAGFSPRGARTAS